MYLLPSPFHHLVFLFFLKCIIYVHYLPHSKLQMTLNILPVAFVELCQLLICAQERRLSINSSDWELGYKGILCIQRDIQRDTKESPPLLIPGTMQLRNDLWLSDPAPLPRRK